MLPVRTRSRSRILQPDSRAAVTRRSTKRRRSTKNQRSSSTFVNFADLHASLSEPLSHAIKSALLRLFRGERALILLELALAIPDDTQRGIARRRGLASESLKYGMASASRSALPRFHIGSVELSGETRRMSIDTGPRRNSSPSPSGARLQILSPRT